MAIGPHIKLTGYFVLFFGHPCLVRVTGEMTKSVSREAEAEGKEKATVT